MWKSGWPPLSVIVLVVSVDVKQHEKKKKNTVDSGDLFGVS